MHTQARTRMHTHICLLSLFAASDSGWLKKTSFKQFYKRAILQVHPDKTKAADAKAYANCLLELKEYFEDYANDNTITSGVKQEVRTTITFRFDGNHFWREQ